MNPEDKIRPNSGETPSPTRKALPLLALFLGLALVAYAVKYHHVTVFVENEAPVAQAAPHAQPPRDSFLPPLRDSFTPPPPPPAGDHFAASPPPALLKEGANVPQTENDLILETTRGGLIRLDDGRIKRTYSDTPPSVCPT